MLDSFAGWSVPCASVSQEGPPSPEESPWSPRCESVFAGHELYYDAERKHGDGCSHCQPTPDDQLLGGHGAARWLSLGLWLEGGSLQPGDAREHHAVLRFHPRCNDKGTGSAKALGLKSFA